jgi:6-pyruvoyltetrahydropterin/6-carboxytetrahydropterin synthase
MSTTIWRTFDIYAAHYLPGLCDGHPCARMHGHNYKVTLFVTGEPDPKIGWFVDWDDIGKSMKMIVESTHHNCLNDVPGLENPTCENFAAWLWRELAGKLGGLSKIKIKENPYSGCVYTGPRGNSE